MFSKGIRRELTWLITSLWAIIFFAWISGWWLESFIIYFVFYVGRQLWSMRKFERWMEGGSKVTFPPSSGLWNELSYQASKKQRALEKHADLQLYKSEQFKAASMLIPDAIVSLDVGNHIEWFNESTQVLLEFKREDVGRRIEGILRQPSFVHYLKSQAYENVLTIQNFHGKQRVFQFQLIPYFESHKLLIVKDITELYNLAQVRRDFIANASHELRTPLTVLKGYLEVMVDTPGPHHEMWHGALVNMEAQSNRMQAIIEDLLTLSAIESESLVVQEGIVDVPKILQGLEVEANRLSDGKHAIQFDIDETLLVKGLVEPLKSVFMNLVSNAIRYTPEGGKIQVGWYRNLKGAHFYVKDNGIGIEPEHIPRLTERFYRVDSARSRVTGGTGLGLAIVKHILERHQSSLVIESQLGKGSTFSCNFPLKKIVDVSLNK